MKKMKYKTIENTYKERDVVYWKTHLKEELKLYDIQDYSDRVVFAWLPQALGAEEEVAIKQAALALKLEVNNNSILIV